MKPTLFVSIMGTPPKQTNSQPNWVTDTLKSAGALGCHLCLVNSCLSLWSPCAVSHLLSFVDGLCLVRHVAPPACFSDRLNLPSMLVLSGCGITCAGDENEIAAFCAHVSELDLSHNLLEDWREVKEAVFILLLSGFKNSCFFFVPISSSCLEANTRADWLHYDD